MPNGGILKPVLAVIKAGSDERCVAFAFPCVKKIAFNR
jgi:hypothetical protein